MNNTLPKVKTGDCEVCSRPEGVETNVTLMHGNIWMCATCKAEDIAVSTVAAKETISYARQIDTTIQLKADIYEKTTTSFIALQGAVQNNADIPDDKKDAALLAEADARLKVLSAAIFEMKAALVNTENERRALLASAQSVVARLRESERAKYKHLDVNYTPVTKVVKPKTVKTPKVSYKPAMVREFAMKYGVDASMVQAIIVSRNLDPDSAAKEVARMMGKSVA